MLSYTILLYSLQVKKNVSYAGNLLRHEHTIEGGESIKCHPLPHTEFKVFIRQSQKELWGTFSQLWGTF